MFQTLKDLWEEILDRVSTPEQVEARYQRKHHLSNTPLPNPEQKMFCMNCGKQIGNKYPNSIWNHIHCGDKRK